MRRSIRDARQDSLFQNHGKALSVMVEMDNGRTMTYDFPFTDYHWEVMKAAKRVIVIDHTFRKILMKGKTT